MDEAASPKPAEFRQVMAGLGLAMLLSALDQTIVVTAMPTIGQELGDPQNLPLIVTSYLVAATTVTPLYGKFADVYGRRHILAAGLIIFILGSVACAMASTMGLLAAARFLQGMGGGGLISLAQTVIADLVTPRERGRYQTYFAAVFATSSIAGPVLGGFFAQYLHWSLIFWINVPLGLAALSVINRRLKLLPQPRHPHQIDYFGASLLVVASGALVLALGRLGGRFSWISAPVLGLFGLSALFWAIFVWRTWTFEEPLIPTRLFKLNIMRDAVISSALGLGAFVGLSVVMPIYFEGVIGLNPRDCGLALIPLMIATVIGAASAGRIMAHHAHYKIMPVMGLLFAALAALFLAWRLESLSFLGLNILLVISTFGVGAMLPIATVSVQNAVDARDLGTATAAMQFFRQLGAAALVALFGVLALGGGRADLLASATDKAAVISAIIGAYRGVFLAIGICLAFSCFFLAKMEERPLRGGPR
ncbi:MAG: MDR family MFS transporter [Methylocystis sp.]